MAVAALLDEYMQVRDSRVGHAQSQLTRDYNISESVLLSKNITRQAVEAPRLKRAPCWTGRPLHTQVIVVERKEVMVHCVAGLRALANPKATLDDVMLPYSNALT